MLPEPVCSLLLLFRTLAYTVCIGTLPLASAMHEFYVSKRMPQGKSGETFDELPVKKLEVTAFDETIFRMSSHLCKRSVFRFLACRTRQKE